MFGSLRESHQRLQVSVGAFNFREVASGGREVDQSSTLFYEFGIFRLDRMRRAVTQANQPVALPPKAFDLLFFLVQNSGQILDKDEIMKALWAETIVEDSNLTQNIFLVRKALGDDGNGNSFIQTIPRRGYKFILPVKQVKVSQPENGLREAGKSVPTPDYWKTHSPFRGLQVFEPQDYWLFFGREAETNDLLTRLARSSTVVVVGDSGSGKSSLVRAGLIAAVRQGRFRPEGPSERTWRIVLVRPSAAPFDYLSEVLPSQLAPDLNLSEQTEFIADCRVKLPLCAEALRNAVTTLAIAQVHATIRPLVLLVVDQFEELFTLTADHDVRERYINALLATSQWEGPIPVYLVLVLRADFYSRCLQHPGLSRCLENNLYNVPRMTADQLRMAIEKRLALAGGHAEGGLIDAVLTDVGTEPGDLALLEHALSQLWEKCGGLGCTLTNEAYSAIGRLRGALGVHADEVYGAMNDEAQKQLAQKVFLELVHLGEGAPDTRRRVRKADLLSLSAPEQVEGLLAGLASSRLISISREEQDNFVEVSHEALIREWSTLREWIEQNSQQLRLERRLIQAAEEWRAIQRDASALLHGARLAQAKEWLSKHPKAPPLVEEFLKTSINLRMETEQSELSRQRMATLRFRRFSMILVGLLLVALGTTLLAHRQLLLAESRALAAQSEETSTQDQGRALDLAIRGWNTAKTQESHIALARAFPQMLSVLPNLAQLGLIRVGDAIFSPNGQRIAIACSDNTAQIWDTDGGLLVRLGGHAGAIYSLAFSPDGKRILTASSDQTARIWDATDGRLLATLHGHTDTVVSAVFSPDGQRILTASADHTMRLWSTDGHLISTFHHINDVGSARFSADGQRIVTAHSEPAPEGDNTATGDHTARVWSRSDGRLLLTLKGHKNFVVWSEFSPDSQRVVTGSLDHTARVWDVTDGRLLATLQHEGVVSHARFSPDGERILTASTDQTARMWSLASGRLLLTLHHNGQVTDAEFSPDGRRVITASADHTARIWDSGDGRLLGILQGHTQWINIAVFSSDGQHILTSSADHTARIWNLAGGRLLAGLEDRTSMVTAARFSADGQRIVTAAEDHMARVWRSSDGRLLNTLRGHTDGVVDGGFSPDGEQIVTASTDHTARIWNAADGHLLRTLQGHGDIVTCAAFSHDGQRIVTTSADQTAKIWSGVDGHLLLTLTGHRGVIYSATFSSNDQLILTASSDQTAKVWNVADGRLLATLEGHKDSVYAATFSPDGRRIVTASFDHTARVWNSSDGQLLAVLQGHTDNVWAAAFSPDGERIVTASGDHSARVWSSADGQLLAILRGHTGAIYTATFSHDGRYIVTAGIDQTARVWNTGDGSLLVELQGHTSTLLIAKFSPDDQKIPI